MFLDVHPLLNVQYYNVGLLKRIHLFKNRLVSVHYIANILLVPETQTALRQIPALKDPAI